MEQHNLWILSVVVFCISIFSCDVPFSPKGKYIEQLVVYSILYEHSNVQLVRIYTTYDPPELNPLEIGNDPQFDSAYVIIRTTADSVVFRDTLVVRENTTRFQNDIIAFVADGFKPVPGIQYTLHVAAGPFAAEAHTSVPNHGVLSTSSAYVFENPSSTRDDIFVTGQLQQGGYGSLIQIYVAIDVLEGSLWVRKYEELPIAFAHFVSCTNSSPLYPQFVKTASPNETRTLHMPNLSYRLGLASIIQKYSGSTFIIRNATIILRQFDEHLYKYYHNVNGFKDDFSIRLDEPDYSNIIGGRGVFGAMTVDSLIVPFASGPDPGVSCN